MDTADKLRSGAAVSVTRVTIFDGLIGRILEWESIDPGSVSSLERDPL